MSGALPDAAGTDKSVKIAYINRDLKSSFKAETFYCIQNGQIMPSASSCSGRRPRRPLVCIASFDFHGLPSRQPLQAEEEIITFLF